jgi:hypothetical protein
MPEKSINQQVDFKCFFKTKDERMFGKACFPARAMCALPFTITAITRHDWRCRIPTAGRDQGDLQQHTFASMPEREKYHFGHDMAHDANWW